MMCLLLDVLGITHDGGCSMVLTAESVGVDASTDILGMHAARLVHTYTHTHKVIMWSLFVYMVDGMTINSNGVVLKFCQRDSFENIVKSTLVWFPPWEGLYFYRSKTTIYGLCLSI